MKLILSFLPIFVFTLIYSEFVVFSIKIGSSSEKINENIKGINLNSYYKEILLEEEMLIAEKLEFIQREADFLQKKKEFIQREISKLDKNNNNENGLSSFLELNSKMKEDPIFKTIALGFPIPRQISYLGLPNNEKYSQIKYCPAGCVVP